MGASRRAAFLGLYVIFAATGVLFLALTAAFLGRRAAGGGWVHVDLPGVVWANTGILLASSVTLEFARRALREGHRAAFTRIWILGTVLGLVFLAGQGEAWRQLAAAGFYVAGNPSSGFFYILTAAHGAHVFGGLIALSYVTVQALRYRLGPAKRTAADLSACFWHFLDVLWLGLLGVFLLWG